MHYITLPLLYILESNALHYITFKCNALHYTLLFTTFKQTKLVHNDTFITTHNTAGIVLKGK